MTDDGEPPYVDEHALTIAAPRAAVWATLARYVDTDLTAAAGPVVSRLLGTRPPGGFAVAQRAAGERVELVGRHHFSRYRLVFAVEDTDRDATRLSARTYAAFPGPHGAVYRLLVIRSRFHVLATRRMLRQVRRRSLGGG
ncbi:hypothetical protein [Mumia sp. DW29H23]|uniref:hypothetical protein n=1 Tax=Mumia sp. DW29H23 TaxID=3421241 RepID=UPI003D68D41D